MSESRITLNEVMAHLRLDDDFYGEVELLQIYTDAALEA
ncbi:phage gp6-like head-tail connector protein, partial [Escherichia coli]|nr:phage gp6-like head-tail connector protein [Escherichia coli]